MLLSDALNQLGNVNSQAFGGPEDCDAYLNANFMDVVSFVENHTLIGRHI